MKTFLFDLIHIKNVNLKALQNKAQELKTDIEVAWINDDVTLDDLKILKYQIDTISSYINKTVSNNEK